MACLHRLIKMVPLLSPSHFQPRSADQALNLQHLTALKKLELKQLQPSDQLPPNLIYLQASRALSLEPLKLLLQLEQLQLYEVTAPAAAWQELLPLLPQLYDVTLTYPNASSINASAAAWQLLAPKLRGLHLWDDYDSEEVQVPLAVVQQLGQLTALTGLELGEQNFVALRMGCSPGALAGVLAGLQKLVYLRLRVELEEEEEGEYDQLALAIAGLRSLDRLDLEFLPLGGSAAHLSQLVSLTSLQLHDEPLPDIAVVAIAQTVTNLKVLNLSDSEGLTGAFMPTLGNLPCLWDLHNLPGSSCTDLSISFLSRCNKLEFLSVFGEWEVTAEGRSALEAALPGLKQLNVVD